MGVFLNLPQPARRAAMGAFRCNVARLLYQIAPIFCAALLSSCTADSEEGDSPALPVTALLKAEHKEVEAVALDDLQYDHASGHPIRFASEAQLHTVMKEDQQEIVLTLGPIWLPPAHGAEHDQHAGSMPPVKSFRIPAGGYLVGMEVEVLDPEGRLLPQAMLHHVNLMIPGRRELFLPVMQRLSASGPETPQPIIFPWPLGIPVDEGEKILLYVMMHRGAEYEGDEVHLRVRIPYRAGGLLGRYSVYPFFIDVSPPPGPASWDLPPGRSTRSWQGSPAIGGRILGMSGHLHRYGVELMLEDVTAEEVLLVTRPDQVAEDGRILSMPQHTFYLRGGLRIHADHLYRITAVYDNPTPDTLPMDAMGAIGGVIRGAGEWPKPKLNRPEYREDLRVLHSHERPESAHGEEPVAQAKEGFRRE